MSAFLLDFDSSQVAREKITAQIDRMAAVHDWYAFLANTICLISDEEAPALSRLLRRAMPELRFIVVEIEPRKKGGWLPKTVWEFIRKPRRVESSAA